MKSSNYIEMVLIRDLIKRKRYDEALKKIDMVYKTETDDVVIKFEYAKLLILTGKTDNVEKGEKYLNDLLKTKNWPFAMLELAKLEEDRFEYNKARQHFQKIRRVGDEAGKKFATLELGILEKKLGNDDEALKYFNEILNTRDKIYVEFQLLELSIKREDYNNALIYLEECIKQKNLSLIQSKNYNFYIQYKLGKINSNEKIQGYYNNQLVNYDENIAIEHIKLHLDENEEKVRHSIFNKDINIKNLYYKVKENLINLNKINCGIADKYIIDFNYNIGLVNDLETSKIEVVTICNTDKIITMYPVLSMYTNNRIYNKEKVKKI